MPNLTTLAKSAGLTPFRHGNSIVYLAPNGKLIPESVLAKAARRAKAGEGQLGLFGDNQLDLFGELGIDVPPPKRVSKADKQQALKAEYERRMAEPRPDPAPKPAVPKAPPKRSAYDELLDAYYREELRNDPNPEGRTAGSDILSEAALERAKARMAAEGHTEEALAETQAAPAATPQPTRDNPENVEFEQKVKRDAEGKFATQEERPEDQVDAQHADIDRDIDAATGEPEAPKPKKRLFGRAPSAPPPEPVTETPPEPVKEPELPPLSADDEPLQAPSGQVVNTSKRSAPYSSLELRYSDKDSGIAAMASDALYLVVAGRKTKDEALASFRDEIDDGFLTKSTVTRHVNKLAGIIDEYMTPPAVTDFSPHETAKSAQVGDGFGETGMTVVDVEAGFGGGNLSAMVAFPGRSIGIQVPASGVRYRIAISEHAVDHKLRPVGEMWMTSLRHGEFATWDEAVAKLQELGGGPMAEAPPTPAPEPAPTPEPDPTPTAAPSPAPATPPGGDEDYQNVGEHISGSRKELAALQQISRIESGEASFSTIDFGELEKEPVQAKRVVNRRNLLKLKPEDMQAAGHSAGAAYLAAKVMQYVATTPEDTPQARLSYAKGIELLERSLANAKSVDEVVGATKDLYFAWRDGYLDGERLDEYERLMAEYHKESQDLKPLKDEANKLYQVAKDARREFEKTARRHKVDPWNRDLVRQQLPSLPDKVQDAFRDYDRKWETWSELQEVVNERTEEVREYRIKAYGIQRQALEEQKQDPLSHHNALQALGDSFVKQVLRKESDTLWRKRGNHYHLAVNHEKDGYWDWLDKPSGSKSDGEAPKGKRHALPKWERETPEQVERSGGAQVDKVYKAKDLLDDFGIRGVQYGDWVKNPKTGQSEFKEAKYEVNERAHHTQRAAEAFIDMADVLGLDHKTVSLNGRLGMAFGARGKGRAKAHYEPDQLVINMTRFAGGGSLGHEWGHFMDNILARHAHDMKGGHSSFISMNPDVLKGKHPELHNAAQELYVALHTDASPEVIQRYKDVYGSRWMDKLVNATHPNKKSTMRSFQVKRSRFATDARELGQYWAKKEEMFARSFESYLYDKLQAKGIKNTYLVSGISKEAAAQAGNDVTGAVPYPVGDERQRINAAFDRFMDVVRQSGYLAKAAKAAEKLLKSSNGKVRIGNRVVEVQALLRQAGQLRKSATKEKVLPLATGQIMPGYYIDDSGTLVSL